MRILLAAALACLPCSAQAQTALEAVIYITDAAEPTSINRESDWTFEMRGNTLNAYRMNNEKKPHSLVEITQLDGCKYTVRWGNDGRSKYVSDLSTSNINEFNLDFSRTEVDRTTIFQADRHRRYVRFQGVRVCSVSDKYQPGVPPGQCRDAFLTHPSEPERRAKAARHLMANFCKARGF